MMGSRHVLSGVLGTVLLGPHLTMNVQDAAVFLVAVPLATLIPDIDHASSTISNTFGFITRLFSKLVSHRKQTHSIVGTIALGLSLAWAVHERTVGDGASAAVAKGWLTIILIVMGAGLFRLITPSKLDDYAMVPLAIIAVWLTPTRLDMVPVAVMLGCVIHIIGDMLTRVPIPVFWPVSSHGYALKLFRTNRWVERWPVTVAMIAGIGWYGYQWIMMFVQTNQM